MEDASHAGGATVYPFDSALQDVERGRLTEGAVHGAVGGNIHLRFVPPAGAAPRRTGPPGPRSKNESRRIG